MDKPREFARFLLQQEGDHPIEEAVDSCGEIATLLLADNVKMSYEETMLVRQQLAAIEMYLAARQARK